MRVEGSLRIIEDMLREVRLSQEEADRLIAAVNARRIFARPSTHGIVYQLTPFHPES